MSAVHSEEAMATSLLAKEGIRNDSDDGGSGCHDSCTDDDGRHPGGVCLVHRLPDARLAGVAYETGAKVVVVVEKKKKTVVQGAFLVPFSHTTQISKKKKRTGG